MVVDDDPLIGLDSGERAAVQIEARVALDRLKREGSRTTEAERRRDGCRALGELRLRSEKGDALQGACERAQRRDRFHGGDATARDKDVPRRLTSRTRPYARAPTRPSVVRPAPPAGIPALAGRQRLPLTHPQPRPRETRRQRPQHLRGAARTSRSRCAAPIDARDQCVALAGVDSNVATSTCSSGSALIDAGRPGRGPSSNPSRRSSQTASATCQPSPGDPAALVAQGGSAQVEVSRVAPARGRVAVRPSACNSASSSAGS